MKDVIVRLVPARRAVGRGLLLAGGLVTAGLAGAALPPQFQNLKDLDAMVTFVRLHPKVAGSLTSIDVQNHVVLFGQDCRAEFARQQQTHPPGWAGPLAPLEFLGATCPID